MAWYLICVILGLVALVQSQWIIQQHLATKSPYWSENSTTPSPAPPGCSLIHLDLVARHGSRFPTSGDIKSMNQLAAVVQNYSTIISNSYPWIKNWTTPYPIQQQGFLSDTGKIELFQMGQRYTNTCFPLLSQNYFPNVYQMQSTQVPRTGVSASSFAQGYLQGRGDIGSSNFQPPYIYSDTPSLDILRFFDNCPLYSQEVLNNSSSLYESNNYVAKYVPAIAARVGQLLGVAPYWNITVAQVSTMFTVCAFEVAVYGKTDGWCSIFSQADISVFEYKSDLEDYWQRSYGSAMAYQISAVVLQSIVGAMNGVISKSSAFQYQRAYLRFAHAETVIPLVSLMGLFKDNYTLTASLSSDQITNRKWRTSIVSPFGGNLAFQLYSCGAGDNRVKLTHNEVEYTIPGCSALYCPFTEFTTLFADALAFNYSQTCALPTTPVLNKSTVPVPVLVYSVVGGFVVGILVAVIFAVVLLRKRRHKYSPLQSS